MSAATRKKAAMAPRATVKSAAAKALVRARLLARPATEHAAAPLVRADLQRKPMRLSASLKAIARAALRQPRKATGSVGRAAGELIEVVRGKSAIAPAPNDRRFDDPTWRDNGLYRRLMQGHLALAREAQRLAGELGLSAQDEARAKMVLGIVGDALAPTNLLLGNPAALKRTLETGGRNLRAGIAQRVQDWRHNGGLPASVDKSPFKVGGNLAATPGDVVYRNEHLELIQYRPQTPTVHGTPLFIVPPQINKYYVWDLAPGRSLIEFLVQQGFEVFVVSWFNPGVAQSGWGLETYVLALEDAMDVTRHITRAPQLHVLGACSGGITSAALLAYLNAKRKDWARSLTLLVAILDIDGIADSSMGLFANLETLGPGTLAERRTRRARRPGPGEGVRLAAPERSDLELLGQQLPARPEARRAFDVLYWNADTTRLPARLHADFLALLESNAFAQAGGVTLGGNALDLAAVALRQLHPGRPHRPHHAVGRLLPDARLLGGRSEFVLSASGHVQSIVNPPGNKKSSFVVNDGAHDSPQAFEQGATRARRQLVAAPGAVARGALRRRQARAATGGLARHPALCAAPGTYVMARG